MEPWVTPRAAMGVCGSDMSVNRAMSDGVLARRRFWLVERVWEEMGIWRCCWIRVLSWEIVACGLSRVRRSRPSLLRILINIFASSPFFSLMSHTQIVQLMGKYKTNNGGGVILTKQN